MKWYMNRKISTKLLIGFLIVALLAAGVGIYGVIMLKNLNTTSNTITVGHGDAMEHMGNLMSRYYEQQYLTSKILAEAETNPELIPDDLAAIKASDASMMESLDFMTSSSTDETMDMINKVTTQIESYRSFISGLTTSYEAGNMAAAVKTLMKDDASGDAGVKEKTKAVLDEFAEFDKNFADQMIAGVQQNTDGNINVMIIIVVVAVGIAIFLGVFISRLISKPIKYLVLQVEKVGEGNLDIIKSDYDIKDETGTLVRTFQIVLGSIQALAADVNMLTEAATAGQLSVRADATKHKGDYKKIVDGINNTLDAVVQPVKETAAVLDELAKGNLNITVEGDYHGDHAAIKEALNSTIKALRSYISMISFTLSEISKGNLTVSIDSDFKGDFTELKNSINSIVGSLSRVMSEINTAAEQVAVGTSQVAEGSQGISQGATEQASSIEELTASITEIAAQTRQNATNANNANELTMAAKNAAVEGNEKMTYMQQAMADISEASANIGKIIKVIDDIAFQTNILALNAAVEAARAGAHGKGFAVVAEEVRNLASRSANAAKETTSLIESSTKKSEAGTKIADETAASLDSIVKGVENTVQLVGEIASASQEQAAGIDQVNRGIEQMNQVVQTNSATAQEAAAASEQLSSQAEFLKSMVGQFRLKPVDAKEMPKALETGGESVQAIKPDADNPKVNPTILLNDNEYGKY